jgi:hypothetical protein
MRPGKQVAWCRFKEEKTMTHQFDELAKALARRVAREALRRVGSVLAGSLLAATGLREVLLFNRHGVPR